MQLASKELSVLAVLDTAAAQQEDLYDCLGSFSKSTQAKSKELHVACKDAVSAFKSQKSLGTQNVKEYLQAATTVAMAVLAALDSEHASSSNVQAVIQGKDVPADVREEANQLTQDLYQSAPAEFWESVMYKIEAVQATANAVIVKYVNNKALQTNK